MSEVERDWGSIELASLQEEKRKVNFDRDWFSRKTAILESKSMCSGSISHVDSDGEA